MRAMVTNTKNVEEPYCRSTLWGSENLPELKRCGSRRRLSGPSQGDAAAKVDEDQGSGGGGGARALGSQRRKTMEEVRK